MKITGAYPRVFPVKTFLSHTQGLQGQLHPFVPGKRESLEIFLLVERKDLDQDPLGLKSTNCKAGEDESSCRFILNSSKIKSTRDPDG